MKCVNSLYETRYSNYVGICPKPAPSKGYSICKYINWTGIPGSTCIKISIISTFISIHLHHNNTDINRNQQYCSFCAENHNHNMTVYDALYLCINNVLMHWCTEWVAFYYYYYYYWCTDALCLVMYVGRRTQQKATGENALCSVLCSHPSTSSPSLSSCPSLSSSPCLLDLVYRRFVAHVFKLQCRSR